jgi:hypothetical protein
MAAATGAATGEGATFVGEGTLGLEEVGLASRMSSGTAWGSLSSLTGVTCTAEDILLALINFPQQQLDERIQDRSFPFQLHLILTHALSVFSA